MKFFHTKYAAYISDMICAVLLGAAVLAVALPIFSPELGIIDCLLIMMTNIALIFLLTRRWWIFPVVLVSAGLIFVLIAVIFDLFNTTFEYLHGLLSWSFSGFPDTIPYSANNSITIVRLMLALPFAILFYLYFRRLFSFTVLIPIVFALGLYLYFNDSQLFFAVLPLLLGVLFISIAKTTGNRISRKLPESDRISSVFHQLSAIIILPFVLFFSFYLSPAADGQWRSKGFVNIVDDFSDYIGLTDASHRAYGTFNMSGFSPLGHRLGGNIELNNDVTMRVKTMTPALLKGAVFDTYSGYSWSDTYELKKYRLESMLWHGTRQEIFGTDKPYGGGAARALYADMTYPAELQISSLVQGTTLFHTGHMESIENGTMDTEDLFFNRQSEIFISGRKRRSLRYTLKTRVFDRHANDFNHNMLALQNITSDAHDHLFDDLSIFYLKLPESLPDSVYAASDEITENFDTPYEKALAIEQWLSENCTYTLTPGDPPEDEDFVAYFLETREGYCVYYASAMTVLARCAGLPARYVIGYALRRDPNSNASDLYMATNATAHAWSEIYLKGIGWMVFDPTSWDFGEYAELDQSTEDNTGYYRPPIVTPPPAHLSDADSQNDDGSAAGIHVLIAAVVVIAAAVLIMAGIRFIALLSNANGYYKRLHHKYSDYDRMMDACYSRIICQMGFFGLKMRPGDTISSFARRIDQQLGENTMTPVCETIIRVRFALETATEDDVMRLCLFSTALEKRLRRRLGLGYLWRRLLLGR